MEIENSIMTQTNKIIIILMNNLILSWRIMAQWGFGVLGFFAEDMQQPPCQWNQDPEVT